MSQTPWESFIKDISDNLGREAAALLANLIPSKIKSYANKNGKITLEFPKKYKVTVKNSKDKKASLLFQKVVTATIEEGSLVVDKGEISWEKEMGPMKMGGSVTEIESFSENGEKKIKFSVRALANLLTGSEEFTLEAAWNALTHSNPELQEIS